MLITSGSSSRESAQNNIELVGPLTLARLAALLALGVVTTLMHRSFHYPLHLPGHHGLEGMALLMIGRLLCTSPFSATLVCMSAAASAAGLSGEHDLGSGILTLAPGLAIDLVALMWASWRSYLWIMPFVVAAAHATKPLIRALLANTMGFEFGSLQSGLLYPVATHAGYGFCGALAAVILWRATMTKLA